MFVALIQDNNLTADYIECVKYTLDPTFKPKVVRVYEQPFLISRVGWGEFVMKLEITFKEWTGLEKINLKHSISFVENGKSKSFVAEIDSDNVKKFEEEK